LTNRKNRVWRCNREQKDLIFQRPTVEPAHLLNLTHNTDLHWDAAEPIVRRWIICKLSPAARLRELSGDAARAEVPGPAG
jgi:hypothetical protein